MSIDRALRRIVGELRLQSRSFALVGGLAVSVRAEPRFTRDADLAIAVADDADAEALVASLRLSGYEVMALVEQDAVGRLATARLVDRGDATEPSGALITDLLFASCGIEPEIAAVADELDVVAGLRMPVATVGHLIAMKLLARDDRRRPTDADDLHALAHVASADDWTLAEVSVRLIEARGFSRQRDLVSHLSALRANGAY